jgi:hypothetical protein
MTNTKNLPTISTILGPFLVKHGLICSNQHEYRSGRPTKNGIGMKTWFSKYAEAFVYEDNTVGLRSYGQLEVELDLNVADPKFFRNLSTWLNKTKKSYEGKFPRTKSKVKV